MSIKERLQKNIVKTGSNKEGLQKRLRKLSPTMRFCKILRQKSLTKGIAKDIGKTESNKEGLQNTLGKLSLIKRKCKRQWKKLSLTKGACKRY